MKFEIGTNTLLLAIMIIAAILLLSACSSIPPNSGPNATLFPGIETPRDRNEMDLDIRHPENIDEACREFVSLPWLSVALACMYTVDDKTLAQQKPWCIIIVPKDSPRLLEEELRHCEGWAHPNEYPNEQAPSPSQQFVESQDLTSLTKLGSKDPYPWPPGQRPREPKSPKPK